MRELTLYIDTHIIPSKIKNIKLIATSYYRCLSFVTKFANLCLISNINIYSKIAKINIYVIKTADFM